MQVTVIKCPLKNSIIEDLTMTNSEYLDVKHSFMYLNNLDNLDNTKINELTSVNKEINNEINNMDQT